MNNQEKYSLKRQFGNKGEDTGCNYLARKGYKIIERNFLRKCGEIDVICIKGEIIHFIEVKTSSKDLIVNRETHFRPEENVHFNKIKRLKKVIQLYVKERGIEDRVWEFSVLVIFLDLRNRLAKSIHLRNIILD